MNGDKCLDELCSKLGYNFKNITLLHEAITHDFTQKDAEYEPYPGVFYKRKRYNRLKTLGNSVTKLLLVEQAIIEFMTRFRYGRFPQGYDLQDKLTWVKDYYYPGINYDFLSSSLPLDKFIKTTQGFFINNGNIENLYRPVFKAILGAIFIDAGGCNGSNGAKIDALKVTRKVFMEVWFDKCDEDNKKKGLDRTSRTQDYLKMAITINHYKFEKFDYEEVQNSFTTRWYNFWHGSALENRLNYNFTENWIMRQAFTKDKYGDEPNYEMLEFLGDAVWELSICEYLYWHFVNDDKQVSFNANEITKYCRKPFQEIIANGLNLKSCIRKKTESVQIHDFLESMIGAVYIDSGSSLACCKKIIVGLCDKFKDKVINLQTLPYSLKTYRGNFYYTDDKYPFLLDYGLPDAQSVFRFRDIQKFKKSNANSLWHYANIEAARQEEKEDYKRLITCSQADCNQLEFERKSFYRVFTSISHMGSDISFENILEKQFRIYDSCKSEMPVLIVWPWVFLKRLGNLLNYLPGIVFIIVLIAILAQIFNSAYNSMQKTKY